MKLHRLRLRNFRGITERECVFAERGVTVVSGANEAGKSSMVEALDLLLEVPSSSKSRRVAAVQPSGHDVGTEVEAEISCGQWRFTYTKVFNKAPSTTLRVSQPKPEQLTGKLAHDRVLSILAQAVDLALLQASRVVQGSAEASVALGKSASVTRALDRAVADRDGCSANGESADTDDDDLLTVVEAEYARYYTPGRGQPTGELALAQAREGSARKALAELEAAVAAIDADVAIIEQASAQRRRLTVAADELKVRVEEAETARAKAYEIRDRFAKAQAEAEAARLRDEKWTTERDLRRATTAKIDALRGERSVATRARAQAQAAGALAHEQEKQHEAA
ncbi:AAA family ATPase, partial [Gordonia sp. UBA7599]